MKKIIILLIGIFAFSLIEAATPVAKEKIDYSFENVIVKCNDVVLTNSINDISVKQITYSFSEVSQTPFFITSKYNFNIKELLATSIYYDDLLLFGHNTFIDNQNRTKTDYLSMFSKGNQRHIKESRTNLDIHITNGLNLELYKYNYTITNPNWTRSYSNKIKTDYLSIFSKGNLRHIEESRTNVDIRITNSLNLKLCKFSYAISNLYYPSTKTNIKIQKHLLL